MSWSSLIAYFFGGMFIANAVPHFVAGCMGRPFQTPFAKPRGIGLSSSPVNTVWAFFNVVVGYLLLVHVGDFHWRDAADAAAFGLGAFVISFFLSRHFGRLHGGFAPDAR